MEEEIKRLIKEYILARLEGKEFEMLEIADELIDILAGEYL